jgi:hypothetical protein
MCDKVDRARKARKHDRLANHECELPIENVVMRKLKAITKQKTIHPTTHATDGLYLNQSIVALLK